MIRAVLFDLDGVLVETRGLHRYALDEALRVTVGVPLEGRLADDYEGLPTRVKLANLAAVPGYERVSGLVEEIVRVKNRVTGELIPRFVAFDPGIYCLIAGLDRLNVRVGVVTNAIRDTARRCVRILLSHANAAEEFGLDIVSPSDGYRPKPDRDIYDAAVTMTNLPPDECLAVEDNDKGVRAAAAAGCRVWQINGPTELTAGGLWRAARDYGGFPC